MRFSITIQGRLVFLTTRRSVANIRARREAAQIKCFWQSSTADVGTRAFARGVSYSAPMLSLIQHALDEAHDASMSSAGAPSQRVSWLPPLARTPR